MKIYWCLEKDLTLFVIRDIHGSGLTLSLVLRLDNGFELRFTGRKQRLIAGAVEE